MTKIHATSAVFALLLCACQAPSARTKAPPPPPVVPSPQVLAPGQTAQISPTAVLRFERLANDSRCKKDVQCIWAGEVTLALILADSQGVTAFGVSTTTSPKHSVHGIDFELLGYGACPDARPGECATIAFHSSPQ